VAWIEAHAFNRLRAAEREHVLLGMLLIVGWSAGRAMPLRST
jgi:ABC-type maltose transport system permease subunit